MAGASKGRQIKERKAKMEEKKKDTSPPADSQDTTPPQRLSPPNRFDGNRDPEPRARSDSQSSSVPGPAPQTARRGFEIPKNLDLGAKASLDSVLSGYSFLPVRPAALNKTGREIAVKLNTWHVTSFPIKPVYQWDVLIGSGAEKRGLINRVWQSKTVQSALGPGWIYNTDRIAWSLTAPKKEIRILVDLDAENGKPPRVDKKTGEAKPDLHRVVLTWATAVPFDTLRAYYEGKVQFDPTCIQAINALDHILREKPGQNFTKIKRSFFPPGQERVSLGGGIEAMKGVYASFRSVHTGHGSQPTLSVNVDVANGTFWTATSLINAMKEVGGWADYQKMSLLLGAGAGSTPESFYKLRSLNRLRVYHRYIEKDAIKAQKEYTFVIEGFSHQTAKQKTFEKDGKKISVAQYYKTQYNLTLQYPDLPLVKMTKLINKDNIHIPAELLYLTFNQRYSAKLNDRQTAAMIKFAVTLPAERWRNITNGINMLDWANDQYLTNYGIKIAPNAVSVKARLLPNPKVQFAKEMTDPRTSGRWDLKNKKFLEPHREPLKSWGVCVMPSRNFAITKDQVDNFIREFIRVFSSHGGRVANTSPSVTQGTADIGSSVDKIFNLAGNQSQMKPQLLVFIVPDKSSETYNRIKKSADCRFGVVSQVLQSAHVQKAQAQYCSNVCMKVNAKLGGITARAVGLKGDKGWFTKPTMIIGADVSHGAPGTNAASIAAMTVSWDKHAIRYAGAVETNGLRVEMITKHNIEKMLDPLLPRWISQVASGRVPEHLIYFRDGVSESQYAHVIDQEVADLRATLLKHNMKPKFTVVIASKRHHVRFFPEKGSGDKNDNPQPGTLVETGITHPFEYDFYLCPHSAIKGTARPVHYHVLMDEAKLGVEELQNMIYESSYQFVRSTTPVSLMPAVYYAHLASNRGTSHIDVPSKSGERTTTTSSGTQEVEIKPLIPMPMDTIRTTMWYV